MQHTKLLMCETYSVKRARVKGPQAVDVGDGDAHRTW